MKKIFMLAIVSLVLNATLISKSIANQYAPTLYVTGDNSSILVGNKTTVDVVVNSLGNQIKTLDFSLVVTGPFDPNGVTYNLHPLHNQRLYNSKGLKLVKYTTQILSSNTLKVNASFAANDTGGYNEGSSAIPLYQLGLVTTHSGAISSYIESITTTQVDGSLDSNNYNPANKPYVISVVGYSTTTPYPAYTPTPSPYSTATPTTYPTYYPTPSPTTYPTATPTNYPTSTPTYYPTPSPSSQPTSTPAPTKDYDSEFEALKQEIEGLNQRVDQQEKEVGVLRGMINQIMRFFRRWF